jgi:hypothetical protein
VQDAIFCGMLAQSIILLLVLVVGEASIIKLGATQCIADFDVLTTIINARMAGVARTELWPKLVNLNDREIEILTWVARGKTSARTGRPEQ